MILDQLLFYNRSDPGITGRIDREGYFKHPPPQLPSNRVPTSQDEQSFRLVLRPRSGLAISAGQATKDSIQSRGVTCSRFRYPCITCRLRGSTRCARAETTDDDLPGYLMQIESKTCRKKKEKTHRTIFLEYYRYSTQRWTNEIFAEYENSWPSLNFL